MRGFFSRFVLVGLSGWAGAVACTSNDHSEAQAGASSEAKLEPQKTTLDDVGLSRAALDESADPCQDFYQFACGGWVEDTEIPADESRWVRSFSVIRDTNLEVLKEILENSDPKAEDPVEAKLGTFYAACMDEAAIEAAGIDPVKPLIERAQSLKSRKDVNALLTELHQRGIWVFWDISGVQDFKDATQVIAFLDHAGLGLPDRDYYFDEDKKDILEKYQAHVSRMFQLAGYPEARAKAAMEQVLRIETRLAEKSWKRVERRNPNNLYHPTEAKKLARTVSTFPWNRYFNRLDLADIDSLNVTKPEFFQEVQAILKKTPPQRLQPYFVWHILQDTAPTLAKAFDEEAFSFKQVLSGQEEQKARWKRCVEATDQALGELLAQPYIERRFAGDSKTAAESYVQAISEAFSRNLEKLPWMDETTKERAEAKREKVAFLIGYPPKWKTYDFQVGDAYAANALKASAWKVQDDLSQIGTPVDRDRWYMTPPTVNAYYSPLKNQMVFPAGILQPPFYSIDAAVPVNLGAMGMVVGHELTHGFDDQGSRFDAFGNLENWWTEGVKKDFEKRLSCVEEQYAQYEPLPGLNLNGKLTLGENVADMGGVKLAFKAYQALREGKEPVKAGGFTEDQQFFLATGQIWCAKVREEEARNRVQNDPHSPPRFRVNGSLQNLPEFAEAFSCEPGTPMNPKDRCEVW